MSLLVYAIAAHGARVPRARGVHGERLQTTRIGALDVLMGKVRTPPRPSARTLRRYDQVVRSIWEHRSAVLPARFGTVLRDPAELEMTVRARRQTLGRQLAIVRHRAQMTVRILPARESVREPPTPDPRSPIPDPRSAIPDPRSLGRRYLEARARASRFDHVPGVAALRAAVRRWVRAERVEGNAGVVTVYHLVPRSAVAHYAAAAGRAAASAGFRVYVSGPWPAYAFADRW